MYYFIVKFVFVKALLHRDAQRKHRAQRENFSVDSVKNKYGYQLAKE